jgi:hypothetical protein
MFLPHATHAADRCSCSTPPECYAAVASIDVNSLLECDLGLIDRLDDLLGDT